MNDTKCNPTSIEQRRWTRILLATLVAAGTGGVSTAHADGDSNVYNTDDWLYLGSSFDAERNTAAYQADCNLMAQIGQLAPAGPPPVLFVDIAASVTAAAVGAAVGLVTDSPTLGAMAAVAADAFVRNPDVSTVLWDASVARDYMGQLSEFQYSCGEGGASVFRDID